MAQQEAKKDAPYVPFKEEEVSFAEGIRRKPFMTAGIVGTLGMIAYGFYDYRNNKLPLSLYIVKYRVRAQSMAIGAITIGLLYSVLTEKKEGDS